MQITYRIPSKKVPYGYLEFTAEADEQLPDPEVLANGYAQYILAYQKAEVQAFESGPKPKVQTVAEITEDEAVELIKRELGGVELSPEEAAKPWNQEPEAEEEKPWESDPVTATGDDWDFS